MAKSFTDVVQDSPRTGTGIPVKTKKPLSRTSTPPAEPPFGPMRFLLALPVVSLPTNIELSCPHHKCYE